MTWIQIAIAIPALFFVWTLLRDFRAGLGEDRLWEDPERESTGSPGGYLPDPGARVYDFRPPRPASGRLAQYPLDREA